MLHASLVAAAKLQLKIPESPLTLAATSALCKHLALHGAHKCPFPVPCRKKEPTMRAFLCAILLAAAIVSTRANIFEDTNIFEDMWAAGSAPLSTEKVGGQDCAFASSSFEDALDSPDIFGLISSPEDSCPHTTAIALGEVRPTYLMCSQVLCRRPAGHSPLKIA